MTGRVILTGATGLIGRATAPALSARGHEVIAVSRGGRQVDGAAQSVACDLLDADAAASLFARFGATHLIHLAWAEGRDRWTTSANDRWALATDGLLRAFAKAGGTRAALSGSCAEYDWSSPLLSEETPLIPSTAYGEAKVQAGRLAQTVAAETGLSLAWVRPFFVYGPGEPEGRLIGDLVRGIRAGRPVPCTDGTQKRDYLYVADLARGIVETLDSEFQGAINIASGQSIFVRDLIAEVAAQLDRPDLVRLGARPRPSNDPDDLCADISLARRTIGFAPKFDLRAGVRDLLAQDRLAA